MTSALQPHAGLVVGQRYRLESKLGEGGMAVVWRALHTETERPVALKLVRPNLSTNEQARELFVREAKIAARIGRSEHIVDVLDAGVDDALLVPFLAMELLEGEPLDERLKRDGPVPHDEAARLFEQLADALDQAHGAGVVHRDLKPQNLFLARSRKGPPILKVLDFGIAKVAEAASQSSTQIGTPAYAAPEQLGPSWRSIAEGRGRTIASTVSPQTDVWALGLTAFETLCAVHSGELWGATTLAELPLKVVLEPTPTATQRAGAQGHRLPPGFDAWLARCLELDATRRFPSAGAAVAALLPSLGRTSRAPTAAPVQPSTPPAAPRAASVAPAPSPGATVVSGPPAGWSGTPMPGWAAASPAPGGGWPSAAAWNATPAPHGGMHGPPPHGPPPHGPPPHVGPPVAPGRPPSVLPPAPFHGGAYAPPPAWAPAPQQPIDPRLAAWIGARGLEVRHADLMGLRAMEPWAFLAPTIASGRELRGPLLDGTISLIEVVRGGLSRATGEDRSVLAVVQLARARARVALRSRTSAGFADNVARGMKMLDALVSEPSPHGGVTSIGDGVLESHFEVRSPTAAEGHAALPPALRSYLVHQHFRGTLEIRVGCFVMAHFDVRSFEPQSLDYLMASAAAVAQAL